MEVASRIRDAVSCGLKVLDEAFTKLVVQDEASEGHTEFHLAVLFRYLLYTVKPVSQVT